MNAFIWGFEDFVGQTIIDLAKDNIIKPKFWLSWCKKEKNNQDSTLGQLENIYYVGNYFYFNSDWLNVYAEKIKEYEKDVSFNAKIYDEVYKYLYHYCDCESRHETKGKTADFHYYLNEFNLLYRFIYAVFVKENIQICLFSNSPHVGGDIIAYHIAKSLGIRTIIIEQSSIPDNYAGVFYMESEEDRGVFSYMKEIYHKSQKDIIKMSSKDYFYMQTSLKQKLKKIKKTLPLRKKYKKYREYLKNISSMTKTVDYRKKYIYFPLHLQPEKTTSTDGERYCDQVLAIEKLSSIIPSDWLIYVKENPKQNEFMRDDLFFYRLKQLDNVKMTPLEENSLKLIKNAQVVSTISGTAGWEALCEGKPVIVFGRAFYNCFEGAFLWKDDLNFEWVANYKIDMNKLKQDYNNLLSRMPKTIVAPEYKSAIREYDEKEFRHNLKTLLIKLIQNNKE